MGYSIRTKTHHYVEWYYWNHEEGARWEFVIAELYDIKIDLDENENIAGKVGNTILVKELSLQLYNSCKSALP